MTNFIPLFPLGIVVFPGETLNLHIFEPRYKQLINECRQNNKPFGIPAVINNKISEMGTLVKLREVAVTYEDGKMDIVTEGLSVFRILENIQTLPEKLYSGAIVTYPENNVQGNQQFMQKIINGVRELHRLLKVKKEFPRPDDLLTSYDVAHHAGMSVEEEYEMLCLMHELQRLEYLKRHLHKVLPVVAEMESLKEKIKLNGHFKDLKGFEP